MFGYPHLIEIGPVTEETVEESLLIERSADPRALGHLLITGNRPQHGDDTEITSDSDAAHKDERK